MTTATSKKAMDTLQTIFSTHGPPKVSVTDSGLQFTSAELQTFLKTMEFFTYVHSDSYHPATNGLL